MADYDSLDERLRELEGRMAEVGAEHDRAMQTLYGNGQPGIVSSLTTFMAEIRSRDKTVKDDLDRHNTKQTNRQNWLMILVTALGAFAAYLAFFRH